MAEEIIYETEIEDVKIELKRDELLETDIVIITRERPVKRHRIGLQLSTVQNLLNLSDHINEIVTRYGDGSVSLMKHYNVEADIIVKLQTCGNSIQIDIRRYCEIDGERVPLRVGVTIPGNTFLRVVEAFKELMEEAQSN